LAAAPSYDGRGAYLIAFLAELVRAENVGDAVYLAEALHHPAAKRKAGAPDA